MVVDTLRADPPIYVGEAGALSPVRGVSLRRLRSRVHSRWVVLAVLVLLVAVSLWLRIGVLRFHYWIDEGISVGIASHPLAQIPRLLRQDGSPPLYYLLLHVWMGLRGRSEIATHELSLLLVLFTVPVAYWAGASLTRRRTGLICATLAAGTPFLTNCGEETRMYALLALLSVVVAAAFVHVFVLGHRRYLPVFVIALTAALYTHNWALFLGLMSGVALMACVLTAPDRRAVARDGAIAFGAVALLYLPWVPTVLYQAAHTGAPWSDSPVLWSLTQGLYALVGGRGAAVALLLGAGSGLLALRADERRVHGTLISLLALGIGTLLTAWVFSKISPAWALRYLSVLVGPLILLVGIGLSRAGRLGLVALALVVLFWLVDPRPQSVSTNSNLATAIAAIRPQIRPGMLVLSTQPEQVPALDFYLPRGEHHYVTTAGAVPDPGVVDWRGILGRLRRSSVSTNLMPELRSLAPGTRVMLVVPLAAASHPTYLRLIRQDSLRWSRAIGHDPAYVRLATTSAGAGAATVPVRITLFVRGDAAGRVAPRRH
jgi:mannosyltransferase